MTLRYGFRLFTLNKWRLGVMQYTEMMGWVASLTSVVVQLVGIELCVRIVRKGSTGDISAVPFVTYFIGACLWAKYGLLQDLTAVIVVNTLASLLQFLYLVIFYSFTIKRTQFLKIFLVGSIFLFVPLIYVKYFQEDEVVAVSHLGTYCVLMSIVSYGAPLASLKDVIRTKSTECLSFPLIFANLVVSIEWITYGYLIKDSNVQLSNTLGAILTAIQVSLFVKYPSKPTSSTLQL